MSPYAVMAPLVRGTDEMDLTADRLRSITWRKSETTCPILESTCSTLECTQAKTVQAEDLSTHATAWTFTVDHGGIAMTTPLVTGGQVYVGVLDGLGGTAVVAL